MNLLELHEYTRKLLAAGVSPGLPVTALVDGYPREIQEAVVLDGRYEADASPKLIASLRRTGQMLTLCPVKDDFSDVLSDPVNGCRHVLIDLPE